MDLLKKILSSSLWLLIGNSIGRLAMFLANIFAARLLSQEIFGQLVMIRNTISSMEGLISGTLGSTVIKKVSQSKHEEKDNLPYILSTIFILNILIAFIISIFIYLGADFIVEKFLLNNTNLINALYIGIIILVSTSFSTLIQNILIGFEEFKKLATLSILTSSISIPFIFILIYLFKLNGALFGIALYFGLDYFIKYFYYKKLAIKSEFSLLKFKIESKKILLFSSPLFLAVIINSFAFWYARIIIIEETNTFKEIAIFDAAFQWLTIIMIITGATTNVALPMLNKVLKDKKELSNIFTINLVVNLGISILISLLFITFSKLIMSIYGSNYIEGYHTLEILSITSIFFALATIFNRYMVSIHKTWLLFYAALIGTAGMYCTLYYFKANLSSEILSYSFLMYYLTGTIMYFITYIYFKRKNHE